MSEEEEWRLFIRDATVKLAFKMLMISISRNSYLSREMDTTKGASRLRARRKSSKSKPVGGIYLQPIYILLYRP